MNAEGGRPQPSGSAADTAAEQRREDGVERFGPLELRRLSKQDGRALIAYSAAERR